jgi:hypothetical protein
MQKPKPKKQEIKVPKVNIIHDGPLERIIRFNSEKSIAQEFAEFGALYHRHRKPRQHLILVWAEYDFGEIQAYMESFNDTPEIEGPEDTDASAIVYLEDEAEEQNEAEEAAQSEAEADDDFDEEELDF